MEPVGIQIKVLRNKAGLSQRALGELVGLRPISILRIERGTTKDIDTIRRVAGALGCNLRILLEPISAAE